MYDKGFLLPLTKLQPFFSENEHLAQVGCLSFVVVILTKEESLTYQSPKLALLLPPLAILVCT
ncbi:hypothetical protein [Pedobacter endophyticus]|uniref:Uncharacterized protein n=1 Tax=Pedobacter endophyticus TaxID=2789740 RepID=A0A7S9PZ68_9SPHI|nr:hypothetical protein [Pedobacter endophyticus]QPH40058.1 hypothetical protein IZT61_01870 [Pedobacter endophyticus]